MQSDELDWQKKVLSSPQTAGRQDNTRENFQGYQGVNRDVIEITHTGQKATGTTMLSMLKMSYFEVITTC